MAIRETLTLELRGALSQLDTLERQIDDLRRPINLDVDVTGDAAREIRTIDDSLDNVVSETQDVNRELRQMEDAASRSVDNFGSLARLMGVSEEHARDVANQIVEAERAAARLDSEAGQVAKALGLSERAASQLVTELRQADRAANDIGKATGPSKLVGVFTGAAVAATAAAVGIGLGAKAAYEAIQSFAELEDSINAVNVVFGDASGAVITFGEDAAQSAGLSQQAFNQSVVPIGSLLQNFGFDAREAADASVILVQRAADLASVMGGSVNDALIAVGAALRGEADPLERYGASISAARVEQFALANGLAATKAEITDAVKLQARYGLILSDTARVSGDFANTSGDLANAQRIVAAEASNLAAQIGEALAPAFEAILAQGPAIIDLFASLSPALADSATAAQAAAAGLTVGATNIVLGFGGMSNAVMSFVDLAQAGIEGITGLWQAISVGDRDFSEFNTQMDEFNKRRAADFINNAGIRMPRAIREGISPINALGQALAGLAQSDDDLHALEIGFDRLRIQSGLTDRETQILIRSLLDQAVALEFTAGEVAFLERELTVLNETFDDGGRANADYLASIEAIDRGPYSSITTRFTTFTSELEEIPERIASAGEAARLASEGLLKNIDPFDTEPPEQLKLSVKRFFAELTEDINREALFQQDIIALTMAGFGDLAVYLGNLGSGAQPQVDAFLKDTFSAARVNEALAAGKTEVTADIAAWLEDAIADVPPGPIRDQLINLLESDIISSPQLEQAGVRGMRRNANVTMSAWRDQMELEAEQMQTARIEAAIDKRVEESFTADDQAEYAATATVTAWEVEAIRAADALRGEQLQAKLGALFSDINFVITSDQFTFPTSLQGTMNLLLNPTATFPTGGTGGGGVVVNNTFVVPEGTNADTQVAQANQSTAAVASIFNRAS